MRATIPGSLVPKMPPKHASPQTRCLQAGRTEITAGIIISVRVNMPLSENIFEYVRDKHGLFASWAAWPDPGVKPKSNMEDLSIFEPPKLKDTLETLHNDYVLVALNISTTEINTPLSNFHGQNGEVYKARYALSGTPLWGSYMTDILKDFQEPDSSKVEKIIKKDPSLIFPHLDFFREEISVLGNSKTTLVAFGGLVYSILNDHLSTEFSISKIDHYAVRSSKEKYREKVLAQIANLNSINSQN